MKRYLILIAALLMAACTTANRPELSRADWIPGTTVYEMNVRQLTVEGTFAAAAQQLPRLKENGVDIVWIMPMFPIGVKERKGTLGSYYSVRDYCAVNPEFGTLEDFDDFLSEAHRLGLKVILDWVANHTSPDSRWTEEHPEWYLRDENGNFVVQHDWTDIAPLDLANKEMRAAMRDCFRFWLDRGVDGFRCDVAGEMPVDYWEEQISVLRKEYPGKYWLAEGEKPELHGALFDATYSWELHHMLNGIDEGRINADSLASYVKRNADKYPSDAFRLTFITNHDENSWAGTEFERLGDAWKAAAVLCWTLPMSQPLMYTGQLVGMHHRFEFFEKDTMPSDEWNLYSDFYKWLNGIYHDNPCLWPSSGSEFEILSTQNNTLEFRRSLEGNSVKVSVQLDAPYAFEISYPQSVVQRVEPLCWWVGMKTPLQLMVQGEGIGEYTVSIEGAPGVSVEAVHKADSPNYLFADVKIDKNAVPGTYRLVFSKDGRKEFFTHYEIFSRREGSAARESFGTEDFIYLTMPDRFSNGNAANDNSPATVEKADYGAFFGRHGGDIQGLENHLDYMADLGVTALWNTPLLLDNEPGSSYHGYACADYYHIDPRFGGNSDYRHLVQEAHKRGIKMIMDIVTNHCGAAHWWMKDLPFEDWVNQWPEYTHSNCAFSAQNDPYCPKSQQREMEKGWFDTSMPDMNLDNPFVLQYFKQWAVWWMEWADLDGFRVDTFPYNEKWQMARWCESVRKEYPNINIVGEVWSENVPQVAYWQADNPNRDGFNSNLPSIMDFPLYGAITRSINVDHTNWEEGMPQVCNSIADDVYFNDVNNMMIFPGNHDTDRIADIVNGDTDRLKIVMTLMATLRGYPQIFAGDELGVRSLDRREGHGGLRVDFPEKWTENPAQKDLHDFVKALFNWRKSSDAVHHGKTMHFISRDNAYAYFRYTDDDVVFVYLNNETRSHTIPWSKYEEFTLTLPSGEWMDVLSGETVKPENLTIDEKSGIILHFVPSGLVQ